MSKDKKKKKDKKGGKAGKSSATKTLKALALNPLVADVVAAALVATSAALKDSRRAQRLATEAGDELEALAKKGAEQGKAMWQLALQIGRRALDELTAEPAAAARPKPVTKSTAASRPKRTAKTGSKPKKPGAAKSK